MKDSSSYLSTPADGVMKKIVDRNIASLYILKKNKEYLLKKKILNKEYTELFNI
jgi:hypothetical protein